MNTRHRGLLVRATLLVVSLMSTFAMSTQHVFANQPLSTKSAHYSTDFTEGSSIGSRMAFQPESYYIRNGSHQVFIDVDTSWTGSQLGGNFQIGLINRDQASQPSVSPMLCGEDGDVLGRYYWIAQPPPPYTQSWGYIDLTWFADDPFEVSQDDEFLISVSLDRKQHCEMYCNSMSDQIDVVFNVDGDMLLGLGQCPAPSHDLISSSHRISFGGPRTPKWVTRSRNGLYSANANEENDIHLRSYGYQKKNPANCDGSQCPNSSYCGGWEVYSPGAATGDFPDVQAYVPTNPQHGSGEKDFCAWFVYNTPCGCVDCYGHQPSIGVNEMFWPKLPTHPINFYYPNVGEDAQAVSDWLDFAIDFWNNEISPNGPDVLCRTGLLGSDVVVWNLPLAPKKLGATGWNPSGSFEDCVGVRHTVDQSPNLTINTSTGLSVFNYSWDIGFPMKISDETPTTPATLPMGLVMIHELGHKLGIDHNGNFPSPPPPPGGSAIVPPVWVPGQLVPQWHGWSNVTIDVDLTPTDRGAARCILFMEK